MDAYHRLLKELEILKIGLIIYTVGFLAFACADFFGWGIFLRFKNENQLIFWILRAAFFGGRLFILWYVWKRYPVGRKEKWDNTWKIVFLGIIGMWLWYPSKREREVLGKYFQ